MDRRTRSNFSCATFGSVLFFALLAFVLRALPWRNFVDQQGQYLFYGPDSYDHLRRISLGVATFPAVPNFDSYYGYPVGTGQIWSPLFDYLISAVALLFGGSDQTIHSLGFWLPPVLSFFTILLCYAAGARFFGKGAGIVTACIIALLPGHILYSLVSELDHHVAEPMICLATVLTLLKGLDRLEKGTSTEFDWLSAGGWMVFSIMIWRGSVIFWGGAFLALAVQIIADRNAGRDASKLAIFGRNAFLFAALLLVPICAFDFWGAANGVSFGIISWFHVILLLSFAVFMHLSGLQHWKKALCRATIPIVVMVAMVVIAPPGKKFLLELLAGISVIGGHDPWLDSISELRPMLFPAGNFDIRHAAETMSLFYGLFPLALIPIYRRWRSGSYRDFRYSSFIVWGSLLWVLPLFRERYIHLAALATGLAAGFLFMLWVERLSPYLKATGTYLSAAVLLLALYSPSTAFIRDLPGITLPEYEKSDLMASLVWLRENTPNTSFYHTAKQVPEYGVLSDWGLGAYIDYVARRPTVATNFGWETHGLFESASFLTSMVPGQAEEVLRLNKVRYLFLNNTAGNLSSLQSIAQFGAKKRYGATATRPLAPLSTMFYRLYIWNGSAFRAGRHEENALGKYRLVFQSDNGFTDPYAGMVSYYKIFEFVPGAVIKGNAEKGQKVLLELMLHSQQGRSFAYRDSTIADGSGVYNFIVPYATGDAVAGIVPSGRYTITYGDRRIPVGVHETEIQSGAVIQIN